MAARSFKATPVPVNQGSEHLSQYFLEDGMALRMKLVATKVFRIDIGSARKGIPPVSLSRRMS